MSCTGLVDCLLGAFGDWLVDVINAPVTPFLETIKTLLSAPPSVEAFYSLWVVIVSVISIFYGLFILFAGFNLIVSGGSVERRYNAKQWLQNVLLMVLAVQSSYLLYMVISQLASGLSAGVVSLIDPSFFQFTLDSFTNVALEISLGVIYLFSLNISVLVFAITHIIASVGVLFFPFGLFFYFIPPLRDIGRFIISKLMFVLFLPFFASLILLGSAQLVSVESFGMIKFVLVVGAFQLVNLLMIILAFLAIFRAVMSVLHSDLAKGIMLVKGYFVAALATGSDKKQPAVSDREFWSKPKTDEEMKALRRGVE